MLLGEPEDPRQPAARRNAMSEVRSPSARELFEANLSLVQDLSRYVCHRRCLRQEDVEDFSSYTLLKLIEDNYAVLRSYEGRSSLRTYLTIVVRRLFLDFRVHKWGKWRPTAEVRRLGGTAVELDRLLSRDGQTLENAVEILHARSGNSHTREELFALASHLPQRQRLRFESIDELDWVATDGGGEERLQDQERERASRRIAALLAKALGELSAEDKLILKMRYEDGFTVREIATALHLEARPLYTRFEKCHRRLRNRLEKSGITWREVTSILGWTGADLESVFDFGRKSIALRPSSGSGDLPPMHSRASSVQPPSKA
jgi:RNA polymerase sigma factor (sigma-70 family)